MAAASAKQKGMIDVVAAEALTDELLEEIGFLVRAFGRAEACDRLAAGKRMQTPLGQIALGLLDEVEVFDKKRAIA
jgi:hypothetical protein